ncbi:tRNA threonylcarbamoyladenosine biosynthesis protein TsaB [Pigmentiphaga humi]|uniref:tRNA threonylcarbamoyladenosine biosynthesis protein TsaB n=1 Tax=Pigmentiphaga humi TaxID=2478468 RepID=A0A3P4BAX2_9BURK|nr:tRNA (adenosine(37)-N6)-threonylcarbamoyltransferase complex dimerization subunit type 1 TsaB [Pigmentiphaga humi]VCU72285.1 tRNA threonylcarbamoyladenosine biosynthesis protein TsaB [Pigmentiphaga humi]
MSLHILSLETSSAWCGVALLRATDTGGLDILEREHQGVQEHSARLLPMVQEVLAEAGLARSALDAIAFGQGPGGFTGLRVACGVAQGLGFALDRPLLPVVSHAAVAAQLEDAAGQAVVVAMDARMQEIYLAIYRALDAGAVEPLLAPQLTGGDGLAPWLRTQVAERGGSRMALRVCGDAAAAYPEVFADFGPEERAWPSRPTAAAVARLAHGAYLRNEAIAPEHAMPLYVRDKVAFTTSEREAGLGGNPRVAGPGSVS